MNKNTPVTKQEKKLIVGLLNRLSWLLDQLYQPNQPDQPDQEDNPVVNKQYSATLRELERVTENLVPKQTKTIQNPLRYEGNTIYVDE